MSPVLCPCLRDELYTHIIVLSVALSLSLLLLTGFPEWILDLPHHLPCLGPLKDTVISTLLYLLFSAPVGLCLVDESIAFARFVLCSWLTLPLVYSYLHQLLLNIPSPTGGTSDLLYKSSNEFCIPANAVFTTGVHNFCSTSFMSSNNTEGLGEPLNSSCPYKDAQLSSVYLKHPLKCFANPFMHKFTQMKDDDSYGRLYPIYLYISRL